MRFFLLLLVLSCAQGCIASGGHAALFSPPARLDASPVVSTDGRGQTSVGTHALVGLHWASVHPRARNKLDVGVGYVRESYHSASLEPAEQPIRPRVQARQTEQATRPANEDDSSILQGGYVEVSGRVWRRGHTRTWVGARAEALSVDSPDGNGIGYGLAGRVMYELFASVAESGSGGFIMGAFGAGMYMETGFRALPGGDSAIYTTVGISVRTPLLLVGG